MGLPRLGVEAVIEGVGTYLSDMNKLGKATNDAADQTEKAAKRSEALSKALRGVGQVVAGLGLTGLFAGMIKEASESESVIAELDAVLKSTESSVKKVTKSTGEWVKANSDNDPFIKALADGLDKATKTVNELQAKVAAGIPLTKEESKSLVEAGNAAAKYQVELAKAEETRKVYVAGTAESATVSHLARQEYLDLAKSLQEVTRFDDEAILSGENMLLTFTAIGKKVFPRATEAVLNLATKFGSVDQAAIQLGKALSDPINGVTALRREGVMLTDAQEEIIKKCVKANDLFGAQAVILDEVDKEFGGLARAAGKTFAGKLDTLNHKFGEVMETAGGMLLPILTQLVETIGTFIDQLGPAAPAILLVAAAFGALTLAIGPLGTMLGIILSPIGAIVAAAAGLYLAFQTNFLGIRDIVESVWKFIGPIVTAIGADISGIFQGLTEGFDVGAFLSDLGWQIKHGLELLFSKLGIDFHIVQQIIDAFASVGNYVQTTLFPALGQFFNWLGGIWNIIAPKLGELVKWFTQTAIPAVLGFITDTVIPGIQDFIDTIIRIWTDVEPFLTDLFNWFVNDALPAIGGALDWFGKNVLTPVIDLLKSLWEVVRPALESLYNWFVKEGLPAIKDILSDVWNNVLKPVVELLRDLWEKYAKPGLEALATFFREEGPKIGQFVGDTIGKALDVLLGIVKSIVDWVGQAIAKLRELLGLQGPMETMNNASQKFGMGQMTGYAAGGNPPVGSWGWVGEHGPELMHFGQASTVIPAGLSQAISGLMVQPAPAYAPAASAAYDNRQWDQSQFTNNFYSVRGADDVMRRMAILRAMGRLR